MSEIIVSLYNQKIKASFSCEPVWEGVEGEGTAVRSRATSPKRLSD